MHKSQEDTAQLRQDIASHSHHGRLRAVLVFAASFLLLTGGNARAQGSVAMDRAALVALYDATGGANWTNKTNWSTTAALSTWHGVTTDSDGRVTRLYLYDNELTGTIPASLGDLSNLTALSLYRNELTGSIPGELGGMTSLQYLYLSDNELTGTIPASLGDLSNLTRLYLYGNELTGTIPTDLGDLSNLTALNLGNNNLTNLTTLSLWRNGLTGSIPGELGGMTSLQHLYLSDNELTGTIPAALAGMTSLQHLYLNDNELTGTIPAALAGMTSLQHLYLNDNELTGSIPASLGDLSNLTRLYLYGNELTGTIPTDLGDLTNLQQLSLSSNKLTGTIPTEVADLTNLQELYLNGNADLTGPLPLGLMNLNDLTTVWIQGTGLCAPEDAAFRAWAAAIDDFRGCGGPPPPRPAPPPPPPRPDAPKNLLGEGGDGQVTLTWDAPEDDGGSEITDYQYRINGRNPWTAITYTDPTNGNDTNAIQDTAGNDVATFTTGMNSVPAVTNNSTITVPGAPTRLIATANGQTIINLYWTTPVSNGGSPITGYRIEISPVFNWTTLVADTTSTSTTYSHTGLAAGTTRYYRVSAINANGTGEPSNTAKVTTGASVPGAPTDLSATASGTTQIDLSWTAPADDGSSPITTYGIHVSPDGRTDWRTRAGNPNTTYSQIQLAPGTTRYYRVSAANAHGLSPFSNIASATTDTTGTGTSVPGGGGTDPPGGGGGGGGPRQTVPSAPKNLLGEGGDGQVTLTWDAPEDDGGSEITDYQYRINGRNPWTAIGSTDTTHTVTGLVNGTVYVFEVRAVNRNRRGRASNRAEATPEAPEVFTLDFAHFANGAGTTSDLVFVNVATHPIRPVLYFYDREGHPMDPESVVDLTEDLEVTGDGGLSIQTEMEPLGELTVSTHGRGDLVSGSVAVAANGPIGGVLRFDLPDIGVAGVGASPPVRDALFPARRQAGGIRTAAALHNLGEEAITVSCRLMSGGRVLEAVEIDLEANGQEARYIEELFTATDTSDFVGSVRCTAPGRFTGIAVELDEGNRIFTTLPVVPVARAGGGGQETVLDFAHFANGSGTTSDLVFVNVSPRPSGPGPTPYHAAVSPSRPALYFYDQEGNLMDPASVVDLTGDLEITGDGALSIQTEMEPLGELTISTHGRGALVSGSVKVVSEGPIGGVLRYALPGIGVTGVGASPPVRDALFPVRQEGGLDTAAAIRNLTGSDLVVTCRLMKDGAVLEETQIPLAANGQEARYIEEMFTFTGADVSDFVGSVRCTVPPGEAMFTGVAVELDASNQIFTTLPVVPVQR